MFHTLDSSLNPIFLAAATYATAGEGTRSILADLNGDGKPDLIVASEAGPVAVLLGNGDGTFQPALTYGENYYATSVVVADVNKDGKADILSGIPCVDLPNCDNGGVGVMLGNGDGTFQPEVLYSSGGYDPQSLAVADVNGDGKPDLV